MIAYRNAEPADGPALSVMAKRCFTDTFGSLYRASDLAAFLDETFGVSGLPSQIDDPAFTIRLALDGEAIVGFAKIGPHALPFAAENAVELYQLYVLAAYQGEGVGPALMDWAVASARATGAERMTLSVYVDNHRAKAFYARYGFEDVGRYDFPVGEHIDEDRLMVARL